jgi:hypothetical protein
MDADLPARRGSNRSLILAQAGKVRMRPGLSSAHAGLQRIKPDGPIGALGSAFQVLAAALLIV